MLSRPTSSAIERFLTAPSYARSLEAVQEMDPQVGSPSKGLRIVLGGNCTMSFLKPGLAVALGQEGIAAVIEEATYDGWIADALAESRKADLWVVWVSSQGLTAGGTRRTDLSLDGICAAAERIVRGGARLFLILPEAMIDEGDPFSPLVEWRARAHADLRGALPEGAIVIDPAYIQRRLGQDKWHDPRYWSLAKSPLHPDAVAALGLDLGRIVAGSFRPRVKAVVVDLDNTLWGGVVGEQGAGGVDLDAMGAGRPHLHLQRFLKDLTDRGMPLAVVSKNNPEDAFSPFRQRPEMILSLDDFVIFEASWEHKYKVIAGIAETLSLPTSSICFLDDSSHERAEARHFLPDLIVPELSEDSEAWISQLVQSGLFLSPLVNDDDRKRVASYRSAVARHHEKSVLDVDSYLSGLEMVMAPTQIGEQVSGRVLSLLHKTNQFNLTTRRHGPLELGAFCAPGSGHYAYCFSVADRFGDAGIVGVLLAETSGSSAMIDTLLMSCRVLGRGIEYAMLDHFRDWLEERGIGEIRATFLPTPRNAPAAGLLPSAGFVEAERKPGGEIWYRTERLILPRHFVKMVGREGSCDG